MSRPELQAPPEIVRPSFRKTRRMLTDDRGCSTMAMQRPKSTPTSAFHELKYLGLVFMHLQHTESADPGGHDIQST